jgi:hypothetical protein
MNLTFCEIRSVLFMGLMVEWKSGILYTLYFRKFSIKYKVSTTFINIDLTLIIVFR